MIVYLALVLLPIGFKLLTDHMNRLSERQKRITFCVMSGTLLFLVIGLRHYSVGSTDSEHYYNHWIKFQPYDFQTFKTELASLSLEKGYLLSVWFFSQIFPDPQFIFILSALFFAVTVMRFIYLYSDHDLISYEAFVCLGLYGFMVQGMRQALAMCFCLYAIQYVYRKKPIHFLIMVLLASQFHQTAIAFVIVYAFRYIKVTNLSALIATVVSLIVLLLSPRIVTAANAIFGRGYDTTVDSGGFVATLVYFIVLFIGGYAILVRKSPDPELPLWVWLSLLGCVIYVDRYFGVRIA